MSAGKPKDRGRIWTGRRSGLLLITLLGLAVPADAHEPIFGQGPHTLFKGGIAVAASGGRTMSERDAATDVYSLAGSYGITPFLQLGAVLPLIRSSLTTGLADPALGLKWRYWNRFAKGSLMGASIEGDLSLPAGSQQAGLSVGAAAYTLGLTFGYESLRWYHFSSARVTSFNPGVDKKQGTRTEAAVSVGVRPWIADYKDPDLVLLLEVVGRWADRDRLTGSALASASRLAPESASGSGAELRAASVHGGGFQPLHGGDISPVISDGGAVAPITASLGLAPDILLSWRNWMWKSGMLFPVVSRSGTVSPRWQLKSTLIVQF